MSRMASFPSARQPVSAHWVFLILISCLAMHFLIEDSRLLNTAAAPESARTSPLNYDEVTHQDDLAIPVLLPQRVANNDVPAAYLWIAPSEKQAASPIFPPPKIA